MESKYDPDAFFSAERYPLPMKCSECGKTMRPVHKHCTPDMPRTYFCTFCGVGIYEDNPGIRFKKPQTNADRIRQMSDIQIAKWISLVHGTCVGFCPMHDDCDGTDCDGQWLDWLQQEVET